MNISIPIHINGDIKGSLITKKNLLKKELMNIINQHKGIKSLIFGKEVKKTVVIRNRMVNIITI